MKIDCEKQLLQDLLWICLVTWKRKIAHGPHAVHVVIIITCVSAISNQITRRTRGTEYCGAYIIQWKKR